MLGKLASSIQITDEKTKDSGLALTLIFLLVGYFFIPPFLNWAILPLLISMVYPPLLKPFAYFWYSLSLFLGSIMSRVILTIIFYLIITPIGIVRSILSPNQMNLNSAYASKKSTFQFRDHMFTSNDLEPPY